MSFSAEQAMSFSAVWAAVKASAAEHLQRVAWDEGFQGLETARRLTACPAVKYSHDLFGNPRSHCPDGL